MKKLLNTLYVTTENAYLSLDGENVVISAEDKQLGRLPLHTLDGIVVLSYVGASPALMGKCAEYNKSLVFLKPSGAFLAKVTGKNYGNILLRREQYRVCDDEERSLEIARNMIAVKIKNCAGVLQRAVRDHSERIDAAEFERKIELLKSAASSALDAKSADSLRGLEGDAAVMYFSLYDDMILQQKDEFYFKNRSKRPPMDRVNAMMSFTYSMLTSICVSALETVGLDPYAGFFHTERPGRCSLALDLVEEFRAAVADRFVLTEINRKMVSGGDFVEKESGGILLKDESRRRYIADWQRKKQDTVTHPFLEEKVEYGLLPYVQAMLLARYIRGDIDGYPPYVWR